MTTFGKLLTPWTIALGLGALVAGGCSDDDSSAEDGGGSADSSGGTAGSASMSAGSNSGTGMMTAGSASATGGSDDTTAGPGGSDTVGDASQGSDGSDGDSTGEPTGGSEGSGSDGGSSSGGDGTTDGGVVEICEAPGNLITCDNLELDDPTIFNAIGLNCPGGGPDEAIPIVGEGFNYNDAGSWAIASQFGTYLDPVSGDPFWGPREGENFLVLSSGQVGVPNVNGALPAQGADSTSNQDNKPLPAPMSPLPGSGGVPFVGCDGVNDCSDSLQQQWNAGGGSANDLIWFQFSSQVPGGTHGFALDFAYFSEEFPEYVGTTFNDMFVVWSNSETYTGNLCFVDDQPCTVTALWPTQFQNNSPPELAGTGFSFDGATGWFQIKGSAEPLELLQLTFAVFDMGDTILDTYVILDNFAWDCEGCTPSEVNPCGVVDPV